VLGASRIVQSALCAAADGLVEICAVAARDLDRAVIFAREHRIPHAYGSYAELLSHPGLEAVYVALPCALHAPWVEAALKKDLHVLCEKPFSLSVIEAQRSVALAESRGLLLMEAHHWRYHPLIAQAERLCQEWGPFSEVQATFQVELNNPGDIRLNPALGACAVMDFGCYAVQWADWIVRASHSSVAPGEVTKSRLIEEVPGVDLACEVELSYPGVRAELRCDLRDGVPFVAFVRAQGRNGFVHFENPLGIEGSCLKWPSGEQQLDVALAPSTYRGQLEAFVESLRSGRTPPTSGEVILETQATLDAIYRKAGVISRVDLRAGVLREPTSPLRDV
jgi:predicted dehydrogenase